MRMLHLRIITTRPWFFKTVLVPVLNSSNSNHRFFDFNRADYANIEQFPLSYNRNDTIKSSVFLVSTDLLCASFSLNILVPIFSPENIITSTMRSGDLPYDLPSTCVGLL